MSGLHYKKVVILGATGFLGRHLADYLRRLGADVLGLDLPELDVTDRPSLQRAGAAIHRFSPDGLAACVNATGLMDAAASLETPERFYAVNGTAVGRIYALCRQLRLAALIHLSSESVFGGGEKPFAENGRRAPRHPYGISKLLAELLLEEIFAGAPAVVVLRLPVVVGIGQAVGNPVSIFCHEATSTGMIELFNGGGHRRKFVALGDVAGQIRAILAAEVMPALSFYNIGGYIASMREVAEAVCRQVPEACIVDRESGHKAYTLVSTSACIERDFGFVPRESLSAMIAGLLRPAVAAVGGAGRARARL